MRPTSEFLEHPGFPGPFGAIMDEYARAAEEFCGVVESVPQDRFTEKRESEDPDTTSIRAICRHVVNSSLGYSNHIRQARGLPIDRSLAIEGGQPGEPGELRAYLRRALRYTEASLDGLHDATYETVTALASPVRWGPIYDPEMILEHGIVHLLRHRRQIERWLS